MKNLIVIITLILFCCTPVQAAEKLFESGFESSVSVYNDHAWIPWTIIGTDASTGDDWTTDIVSWTQGIDTAAYGVYGANQTDSCVTEIVADPDDAGNQVFHFDMDDTTTYSAHLEAALQFTEAGATSASEFYVKYKMRFHNFDQFKNVLDDTYMDWFMLFQVFEQLDSGSSCQISNTHFGIHKNTHGVTNDNVPFWYASVRYTNSCDTGWVTDWYESNTSILFPEDEWFDLEIYYKQGNSSTGRFIIYITTDGGGKQTLFDVTDATQNPTREGYMDEIGFMQVYFGNGTIDAMATAGYPLEVWYDDLEFWDGLPDTETTKTLEGCTPVGATIN